VSGPSLLRPWSNLHRFNLHKIGKYGKEIGKIINKIGKIGTFT